MTAKFVKRILDRDSVRGAAAAMAAAYLRFVFVTSRWEYVNAPEQFWDAGQPFIAGYWHGRLLMLPFAWRRRVPVRVMISRHRDGDLITRTVQRFGFGVVRGSTNSAGAVSALRELLREIKRGITICLCPDGPRGPRMRANEGIVLAARLSGAPVLPVAFGITRRVTLGTWDRMVVPLPFSRGVFVWGDPILVPKNADPAVTERARAEIEASLIAVSAAADRATGHAPVEPAPLPTLATARS